MNEEEGFDVPANGGAVDARLPAALRAIVRHPSYQPEVSLQHMRPRSLGVRLAFTDIGHHDGFCRAHVGRKRVIDLNRDIHNRFDVMDFYWVRLRYELTPSASALSAVAQNFIVNPALRWPITTVRVFLRRYGDTHDVERLEPALRAVRQEPGVQFGMTTSLHFDDEAPATSGRVHVRIPRARLSALLSDTFEDGLLSAEAHDVYADLTDRLPDPLGHAFVSFGGPSLHVISIDLDEVCAADLPVRFERTPVALPPFAEFSYVKCRPMPNDDTRWTAYCPWSRFTLWCELEAASRLKHL